MSTMIDTAAIRAAVDGYDAHMDIASKHAEFDKSGFGGRAWALGYFRWLKNISAAFSEQEVRDVYGDFARKWISRLETP